MVLPFQLIQKIICVVALTEKQPALALGARLDALFHKAAIGRNAGASADHDDRRFAIGRQTEVAVRLDVNARRGADLAAFSQIHRCDALALLAV